MSDQMIVVVRALKDAFASKSNVDQLLADPAAIFRRNGLSIPEGDEKGFNDHFNKVAGSFLIRFKESTEDQLLAAYEEPLESGGGYTWCEIAAYSVAAVVVAIEVGGITALTVESAVVPVLVDLAGVSVGVALGFISGLVSAIAFGTGVVANRICRWTGAFSDFQAS